ncbi:NAD-dependent epimerase/dehydratase family protein [Dyella caseinilytica]|uniref:NAD-dependent epimerase/dehydratase family protein n=1 Tax=Dyella caseinilytica TaxID=1849581 RepID=A0ABX7GZD2_9GAMM|nr:NAD-dependent epimerase/dehydratase family protein [Dyella caseinilytica]QRN54500.1 NAD-dependent epimerase/dehydratase family protein [Dyella caseinilytica]GFZ94715.1 hypothetical protein GCM10011408_13350 [Dyella caseinilytica]
MAGRILLAGCGDLGQRIGRLLAADGNEVFALRRRPPIDHDDTIRWLQADLTRPETLSHLPDGIDHLIYLPAPGGREESLYRAVFVEGLRYVVHALDASALQRVLFVSSSAVYGEHDGAWVDEDTPPAPQGFNGNVLLEAEQWLSSQPVRSIVMRLAGLYGPGRMQLVDRIRAGEVRAPRQPPHWANRIHIDDAAAAIVHVLALSDPHRVYIGTDDTPLPQHTLYDSIAAMIGAPAAPEGAAPFGVGSKRLSNARLRESGFRVRWPDARDGYAALLR